MIKTRVIDRDDREKLVSELERVKQQLAVAKEALKEIAGPEYADKHGRYCRNETARDALIKLEGKCRVCGLELQASDTDCINCNPPPADERR